MRKALADIAAHFNRKGGYSMNKRVRRILLGILAAMLLFGIVCVALPYHAVATGSPAVRDVAYAAEHWVSRSVLQNGVQAACTGAPCALMLARRQGLRPSLLRRALIMFMPNTA